jgi:hypothetical protein
MRLWHERTGSALRISGAGMNDGACGPGGCAWLAAPKSIAELAVQSDSLISLLINML